MGKYFVAITNGRSQYKLCRDDINRVFSCRIKKLPKIPGFNSIRSFKEDDASTSNEDSEPQFEPIQFFTSISCKSDN